MSGNWKEEIPIDNIFNLEYKQSIIQANSNMLFRISEVKTELSCPGCPTLLCSTKITCICLQVLFLHLCLYVLLAFNISAL